MLRHLRGDGDASCSHIKKGNRRALCAGNAGVVPGGFTKGRKRHEKVRHNGVGNENFALGFPRTHRMAKMREGGIFYHRLLPSRGRQGDMSLWEGDPPRPQWFSPRIGVRFSYCSSLECLTHFGALFGLFQAFIHPQQLPAPTSMRGRMGVQGGWKMLLDAACIA